MSNDPLLAARAAKLEQLRARIAAATERNKLAQLPVDERARATIQARNRIRKPLISRQRQIMEYLLHRQVTPPYDSPSLEEMCEHLGLSSRSTIHHHLGKLRDLGLLIYDKFASRSVRLTPQGLDALGFDLLDRDALTPVMDKLHAENGRLPLVAEVMRKDILEFQGALLSLQWVALPPEPNLWPEKDRLFCPACLCWQGDGHAGSCWLGQLATALAALEKSERKKRRLKEKEAEVEAWEKAQANKKKENTHK